jgi:hypothetical protein
MGRVWPRIMARSGSRLAHSRHLTDTRPTHAHVGNRPFQLVYQPLVLRLAPSRARVSPFRLSKDGRGRKARRWPRRLRRTGVTHAYLGARVVRRRLSSRGGKRRLIPKWRRQCAGLRRKAERVKASPVRSGCGELELAQDVEGAFADLAGDRQSCHGGVAPLASGAVEGEVGSRCAVRVHGRFDERPAQMR